MRRVKVYQSYVRFSDGLFHWLKKRVVLKSSNDGLSGSYPLYGRIYSTEGALAKASAPVGTRVRRCAAGRTITAPKTNYSGGL